MECSICLTLINADMITATSCAHQFHKKCLNLWFQFHTTCPMCRKTIRTDGVNYLTDEDEDLTDEEIVAKTNDMIDIYDFVFVSDADDFQLRVKTVLDNAFPDTYRYYKTIPLKRDCIRFVISKEVHLPSESWNEPEWYNILKNTDNMEEKMVVLSAVTGDAINFYSFMNDWTLKDLLLIESEKAALVKFISFGHDGVIMTGGGDDEDVVGQICNHFPNLDIVQTCGYYCAFAGDFHERGIREASIF